MLILMNSLIVFVSKYFLLFPVAAVVYMFYSLNGNSRKKFLFLLLSTAFISYIFAKLGGHFYYDPRPYIKDGVQPLFNHSNDPNGFPSDHTLLSACIGFVVLKFNKKLGITLLFVAALIGWARVAAHVHHLIDIVGSFIFTGIAFLISVAILNALISNLKHRAKKAD
jgi:membrane-associated phospholipid phosphatase